MRMVANCGVTMGAALRARNYHRQIREIRLRILTHNLAILWRKYDLLYRATEIRDIEIVEIGDRWHLTVKKRKIMALDCDQQIGPGSHCLHHWR